MFYFLVFIQVLHSYHVSKPYLNKSNLNFSSRTHKNVHQYLQLLLLIAIQFSVVTEKFFNKISGYYEPTKYYVHSKASSIKPLAFFPWDLWNLIHGASVLVLNLWRINLHTLCKKLYVYTLIFVTVCLHIFICYKVVIREGY